MFSNTKEAQTMSEANLDPLNVVRDSRGNRHLIDFIRVVCNHVIKDTDVISDTVNWVNATFGCRWAFQTKQTLADIIGSTGVDTGYFYGRAWSRFADYIADRYPKNEGAVSNWVMVFYYHYYNPDG